jgi:hypothetical protein
MKKSILIFLAMLPLLRSTQAQSYDAQRTQVFAFNIIGNALVGGIGGAVNTKSGEKVLKTFARNFFKGAVGGLIKYYAKYNVYQVTPQYMSYYININRFTYFLGHSVVMNAARNNQSLETVYFNYCGIEMRYKYRSEKKFDARLSLASLGSALYYVKNGSDLNLYQSMETGVLYFDVKPGQLQSFAGQALFNTIAIIRPYYNVFPHELVHTYQMYDLMPLSSIYSRPLEMLYENHKVYKFLNRYITSDYEALFFSALYGLQPAPAHYRNYYEFEAQHFQTRQYVPR